MTVMRGERFLPFSAIFNFRDLGGYSSRDGRMVVWRRLFRADSLASLTPDDREAFAALRIRTVIDLRRGSEVAGDGRVPDAAGLTYVNLQPMHRGLGWETYDPAVGAARFLADRYLSMAEVSIGEFGAAVRLIADPQRSPLVMHCHGGRDRTGVLAALILALLGVPDEQIVHDYALSAEGEQRYNSWQRRARPTEPLPAPHLVATPHETMRLFLAELRARFGSIEAYAVAAGVCTQVIEQLRDSLLSGRTLAA